MKFQPLLTRLTRQIGTAEYPDAREEAKRILRERGHMHKNSEKLTKAGEVREAMGPARRAIDRASKRTGHPPAAYKYVNGRAILK